MPEKSEKPALKAITKLVPVALRVSLIALNSEEEALALEAHLADALAEQFGNLEKALEQIEYLRLALAKVQ